MKLTATKPYLETSGQEEERFFSIQDTGMLFDILRNKMYSNPILAIAREISCNARDAHREVGKDNEPIHIQLPNSLQPEYRIKDFGPGISPDRMYNIFIKYTASTKRHDNVQTGGFGLGAKTPFSYSDSFSIVTVHDHIRYVYNCLIDETKVGKILLVHQEPTTQPSGTEIIIPVLAKHFTEFMTWTEQACRYWKVRPIIFGNKLEWESEEYVLQQPQWALLDNKSERHHLKIIVDGVPYSVDSSVLSKYGNIEIVDACYRQFILYFEVGELSLSSNREQIYLDEPTQKKILDKLKQIKKEINNILQEELNNSNNLWEANAYYHQIISKKFNLKFFSNFSWKDVPLQPSKYVTLPCNVFHFGKGAYSGRYRAAADKIYRQVRTHVSFETKSTLYINDVELAEVSSRHVKKAFENDPSLMHIQVISPDSPETLQKIQDNFNLDQMEPRLLSSITTATGKKKSTSTQKFIIYKFDPQTESFQKVPFASVKKDTNEKVLCNIYKPSRRNAKYSLDSNSYSYWVDPELLNAIYYDKSGRVNNISFYGVVSHTPQAKIVENLSQFIPLNQFISDRIANPSIFEMKRIKFFMENDYYDWLYHCNRQILSDLISNKDSFALTWCKSFIDFKAASNLEKIAVSLYEEIHGPISNYDVQQFAQQHPELNLSSLDEKFKEKYPLLAHLRDTSNLEDHMANYINLIDNQQGKKL